MWSTSSVETDDNPVCARMRVCTHTHTLLNQLQILESKG